MADQVLSQDDVDALLNAVSDNTLATTKENPSKNGAAVVNYDVSNQDKIVRGRLPTLDIIHDRFIRLFRVTLSSALRRVANIGIASSAPVKFGEFVNSLPLPSCLNILRIDPLRGSAVMVIESKLLYALIDSFFGGSEVPFTKVEGKDFTPIEFKMARRIIMAALGDLEKAWAPVYPMKFQYSRTEINPQFVAIVAPSDVVIATSFDIELEKISGTIQLLIPYSTLEPIKAKLSVGFQSEQMEVDGAWINRVKEQLVRTEANVRVELGVCHVNVSDLISLKTGDILLLDTPEDASLKVFVEGILKFKASPGVYKGNKAVKVSEVFAEVD